MARVNDHHVSLFSDYESSGFFLLGGANASSSLDSHRPINKLSVSAIIIVFDNSESERFVTSSLNRETSLNESSFDTLISNDNVEGDCAVNSAFTPLTTTGDLGFYALITPEMEGVSLNMEVTQNFIKTYHAIYGRDPSDVETKDHLVCGTQPEDVNWLVPFNIF